MKKLLRHPADRRTLVYMTFHFLLLGLAWVLYETSAWFALPSIVVLTMSSYAGASAGHNALHLPVFTNRLLNRIWQVLLSLTFGYPSSAFVSSHNLSHHKHLQGQRDVLRTTQVRWRLNLVNLVMYTARSATHMMSTNLLYAWRARVDRPRWVFQVMLELAAVVALFATGLLLDWHRAILLIVIPNFTALRMLVAFGYLQHDGCDENDEVNHSRSFVGRAFNWFTFNSGYHTAHHNWPAIHWAQLPEEHRVRIEPRNHPSLNQVSILLYSFRTFLWPARRTRYDGTPIALPPRTPPEVWAPSSQATPADVSSGAVD